MKAKLLKILITVVLFTAIVLNSFLLKANEYNFESNTFNKNYIKNLLIGDVYNNNGIDLLNKQVIPINNGFYQQIYFKPGKDQYITNDVKIQTIYDDTLKQNVSKTTVNMKDNQGNGYLDTNIINLGKKSTSQTSQVLHLKLKIDTNGLRPIYFKPRFIAQDDKKKDLGTAFAVKWISGAGTKAYWGDITNINSTNYNLPNQAFSLTENFDIGKWMNLS